MPKSYVRYYFLLFGLLDAVALIIAFFYSLNVLDIYFSYFTVLSNILITSIFLYFGISNVKTSNNLVLKLYGPAVLYMTITGVIFWSVLSHTHAVQPIPWINIVLHGVTPIAAFVGWLLYHPYKKIPWINAVYWQIPPLLFVAYTLLHGPFIHWYPYPFLNPTLAGGYIRVTYWIIGIITGSLCLSFFLIFIQKA